MKSESWGGGIELSILSEFYEFEMAVVDIQSLHICKFGEDKNYSERLLLLYDGIHYDPLYFDPFDVILSTKSLNIYETNILYIISNAG